MTQTHSVTPLTRGLGLAFASALLFGLTTPLLQVLGRGAGPASTAVLLYAGAALVSVNVRGKHAELEAKVRLRHLPRVLCVALAGAALAPLCLAWGLKRTDAMSGSLLLNFEAVFTALLAYVIYRERIGARVAFAVLAMALGGALLVYDSAMSDPQFGWGSLSIAAATLCWALDNALSRPLADLDPTRVVRWKGALGAAISLLIALAWHERMPALATSLGLLAVGATGYGLSLRLYLYAQRAIGAARTGSMFAVAPFVGAAIAWILGERAATSAALPASALFACGIYLHLSERHDHPHTHPELEHDHAHRHDDGHHDHHHHPAVQGPHRHPHRHEASTHTHAHAVDAHHRHDHD